MEKVNLFFVNCLISLFFVIACGGNNGQVGNPDAGTDSGQPPLCASVNCDDKIACTRDACDEATGECRHTADHALCSGGTVCMPKEGCKSPPPCATDADCPDTDNSPCMQEYCEPASSTCRWNPLDKDGDGHAPQICADIGGDDCDDNDYSRHPGVEENCNGRDEDCDGQVDEGNPGGGRECAEVEGECQAGVLTCLEGNLQCVDAVGPVPEVCDGRDNDCDGETDEEPAEDELPLCQPCLLCQEASCVAMICSETTACSQETNRCQYICPSEIPPPEQQEACMPKEYREAYCGGGHCSSGDHGPCTTHEECQRVPSREDTQEAQCVDDRAPWYCDKGFNAGMECWTHEMCQQIPQEALDNPNYPYPPCVCWGLPCELAAYEWQCPASVWTIDMREVRVGTEIYCLVNGDLYYRPGMDHVQKPPDGPFEQKLTLLDGEHFQYQESNGYTFTCTKVMPED